MTEDDLKALLNGEELFQILDVKTLVLDIVRDMPQDELMVILREKLPSLSPEYVKEYLYMRRT
jgi:hypothetical protein